MARFAAFLRGINVSGQKLIKMEDLSRYFTELGLQDVRTFLQSGNVVFDTTLKSDRSLTQKLEAGLHAALGYDVSVMLRSIRELEDLARLNVFHKIKPGDAKPYITFLASAPEQDVRVPLKSPKADLEVIHIAGANLFCIGLPAADGRSSYPNPFVEKYFGIPATTRNWNTVLKMLA